MVAQATEQASKSRNSFRKVKSDGFEELCLIYGDRTHSCSNRLRDRKADPGSQDSGEHWHRGSDQQLIQNCLKGQAQKETRPERRSAQADCRRAAQAMGRCARQSQEEGITGTKERQLTAPDARATCESESPLRHGAAAPCDRSATSTAQSSLRPSPACAARSSPRWRCARLRGPAPTP